MSKDKTELYVEERAALINAQQQCYQQFDKAILTLASGGLGLSIIFLKDIRPVEEVSHAWLLVSAWSLFAFSILSTLMSFLTSQYAYKRQLELLDIWFVKAGSSMETKNNKAGRTTQLLNSVAAILFFLAVVNMIGFVSLNLTKEVSVMSEKESTSSRVQQGQVPPTINKAIASGGEVIKGMVPPSLPQVPLSQGTQGTTGSTQSGAGQSEGGSQGASGHGSSDSKR